MAKNILNQVQQMQTAPKQPAPPSPPKKNDGKVSSPSSSLQGSIASGLLLFTKAQAGQVACCPFTAACALALNSKGIKFDFRPTPAEQKPDWLLPSPHNGSLPCLRSVDGLITLTESEAIMRFIDTNCGTPGSLSANKQLDNLALFAPLYRRLTNTDASRNAQVQADLDAKLNELEKVLEASGGPYLLGEKMAMADCRVLPQLFMLASALESLHGEA